MSQLYVVKMLKTSLGVNDGKIHPDRFEEGRVYEIGSDLYDTFKNMGVVALAKPGELPESQETEEGEQIDLKNLEALSKPELLAAAAHLGVKVNPAMKPEKLIQAIRESQETEKE